MMYKVVNDFTDLQDNEHYYRAGDAYPHDGKSISDARIKELSSTNNRRHMILIEEVESVPEKGTRKRKKTGV